MHIRINTTYSPINCPAKPFGGVVLVTDRFGKWREAFRSECHATADEAKRAAERFVFKIEY